ncbi:MAG TPA: PEGA domain-containing protein [Candidatus Acidoferrum sp.]|nr:PEGA domain-containing protein [Candidatus Acidoferrum sp.]
MRTLALALAVLGTPFPCAFAQTTMSSMTSDFQDIQTAGGFLDVCGLKESQAPKKSVDVVAKAPAGEVLDTFKIAMDATLADRKLCYGYLAGVIDGWQEGHEHGVMAAHFPAGIPRDKSDPFRLELKSVSLNELQAMGAASKNDVPCLPDHITIGQTSDVVIKYIRDYSLKNPFWRIMLTSRFVAPALRDAFPCPIRVGTVAVTSIPDGADINSDGVFVGNSPATLKLSVGKHTVRVSMRGYKDWSRELTVLDGSEVKLAANLEKQ